MVKDNAAVSSTDSSQDATQLLLKILRNVDREVKTTCELPQDARNAIIRFRSISADLAVPDVITPQEPGAAQKQRAKT